MREQISDTLYLYTPGRTEILGAVVASDVLQPRQTKMLKRRHTRRRWPLSIRPRNAVNASAFSPTFEWPLELKQPAALLLVLLALYSKLHESISLKPLLPVNWNAKRLGTSTLQQFIPEVPRHHVLSKCPLSVFFPLPRSAVLAALAPDNHQTLYPSV